jgi:hypothetical protein
MTLSLNLVPVYQWTHREFIGPDPWADGQPVEWSVVVYRMVGQSFLNAAPAARRSVSSESNLLPRPLVVGIFARAHNRYRILPLALQQLWRDGRVADRDLPWLLHTVEDKLWITDYPPARAALALKLACVACAGIAFLCFSGAFRSLELNQNLLLASLIFTGLTIVCLSSDFYLTHRRGQLGRSWIRMLERRTSG